VEEEETQEAQPVFRKGGKFVGTIAKQFPIYLETSILSLSNDEAGLYYHTNQSTSQ
jgi:hypothetical protein